MAPARPPFARPVWWVLAGQGAILLAMAPFYGPHRDELYFASAGYRLAWGYPDQPALTPFLARLAGEIAPGHLVALRLAPLAAMLAVTLLAAHLSRLLGGSRDPQVLTAAVVGFSAVIMTLGHRLSTATFDVLAWTAVLVLVAQSLLEKRPRLWLAAGLVAGVGLNNKHAVAILLLALLLAVAFDPVARPVLRTPWPWLGGLAALALWVPNLVWQGTHGWPAVALSEDIAREYGGLGGRVGLLMEMVLVFSPVIAVVWVVGLRATLREQRWVAIRPLGTTYLLVLITFLVVGGKGYYLSGVLVPLVAVGCTWLGERWSARRTAVSGAVLVASAAVAWPALVPVLPTPVYAGSFYPAINDDQQETIGWERYAGEVRAVVRSLPPEERTTAVVFTANYGEAGALEWYPVGVPVWSGHNAWRFWGPPEDDAAPVVLVGRDPGDDFVGCRQVGTLTLDPTLPGGFENEEEGRGIHVCAHVTGSWSARWAHLWHYDA